VIDHRRQQVAKANVPYRAPPAGQVCLKIVVERQWLDTLEEAGYVGAHDDRGRGIAGRLIGSLLAKMGAARDRGGQIAGDWPAVTISTHGAGENSNQAERTRR
jgi:hypothetical protein